MCIYSIWGNCGFYCGLSYLSGVNKTLVRNQQQLTGQESTNNLSGISQQLVKGHEQLVNTQQKLVRVNNNSIGMNNEHLSGMNKILVKDEQITLQE